jgi:hypothetical protein
MLGHKGTTTIFYIFLRDILRYLDNTGIQLRYGENAQQK